MPSAQPLILAHAFGARYDLPIPLWLFVLGGAAVVVLSFLVAERRTRRASRRSPLARTWRYLRPMGTARHGRGRGQPAVAGLPVIGRHRRQPGDPREHRADVVLAGDLDHRAADLRPARRLDPAGQPVRRPRQAVRPAGAAQRSCWAASDPVRVAGQARLVAGGGALLPDRLRRAGLQQDRRPAAGDRDRAAGLRRRARVPRPDVRPRWLERGEMFSVLFSTWGRLGFFRFGAQGRRGFAGGLDVPFEPSPVPYGVRPAAAGQRQLRRPDLHAALDHAKPQPRPGRTRPSPQQLELFGTAGLLGLALAVFAVFGAFALAAARAAGQRGRLRAPRSPTCCRRWCRSRSAT